MSIARTVGLIDNLTTIAAHDKATIGGGIGTISNQGVTSALATLRLTIDRRGAREYPINTTLVRVVNARECGNVPLEPEIASEKA